MTGASAPVIVSAVKILIVAPQWIGDCVMAQPLVALLRQQHRDALIAALALPHIAPVLRAMPQINEVIAAPFAHGALQWALRRQVAAGLRERRFDAAYVLPNSIKSALVPWLARIPRRVGYHGEGRWLLLNRRVPNPPRGGERPLMTQFYIQLAQLPAAPLLQPRLSCDPSLAGAAAAKFGIAAPYVALAPGAEYGPAKQWPAAHFRGAALLARQQGLQAVVLGSSRDMAVGDEVAQGVDGALNLCGRTSLDEAIALLAGAQGVLSNDSGLMHIAAALGRPTVGIYGSTDPQHTPPAAHHSATVWLGPDRGVECSPCFERVCPLGHTRCLTQITPEMAWRPLAQLMTQNSATAAPR